MSNLNLMSDRHDTKNEASQKLQPAFYDLESGEILVSRFADGRPAPIHMLDSLADEVMERIDINIISGFVKNGLFLTRQQAMATA